MLKIASNLSFPLNAVTQTFGILAKRGVGKTYLSLVLVEEFLKAKLQVVVADPIGVCWGLRASADGKGPGLPIVVMGGDHGDLPLENAAGKFIADFIVDERQSAVLDLSRFRKGEQVRFMTDFCETLYHRNRSPLHVVLDEADAFAPQKPMRDQARMLGAVEDIVRRGRARGIGVTLVTQRSAVLNKDVLTQVECLIALRTIAPQDRDAIDAWVKVHGTPEKRAELMGTLPSLPVGKAWVWCPGWLDIFKQIKVRKRETFDSSATPEVGVRAREPKDLAPVELEKLKTRVAASIERAKAEDPRELRKRIADLERQLRSPPAETKEVPVVDQAAIQRALAESDKYYWERWKELSRVLPKLLVEKIEEQMPEGFKRDVPAQRVTLGRPVMKQSIRPIEHHKPIVGKVVEDNGITPAKQKILNGLAFLYGIGVTPADKTQLALIAGVSPTSGGYFNNLGSLRTAGLIEYPKGGMVALTTTGQQLASTDGIPATTEELHEAIRSKLSPAKWKILNALIGLYPDGLNKDALANQVGVSPTSGGYFNNLGSLRTLGLIAYPTPGQAIASPVLFLE